MCATHEPDGTHSHDHDHDAADDLSASIDTDVLVPVGDETVDLSDDLRAQLAGADGIWSRASTGALRAGAVLVLLLVIPAVVGLSASLGEAPLRIGEPSPRTVISDRTIQVVDEEATEELRQIAAQSTQPVTVPDTDAPGQMIDDLQSVFDATERVRRPVALGPDGASTVGNLLVPRSPEEQVRALTQDLANRELGPDGTAEISQATITALVDLSDSELAQVRNGALAVARVIARRDIRLDDLQDILSTTVPSELRLQSFPGDTDETIATPLLGKLLRPTVRIDVALTEQAREQAAANVSPQQLSFAQNSPIVRTGDTVTRALFEAASQAGEAGRDATTSTVRAFFAMLAIVAVGTVWLRALEPRLWRSGRRVLLLALLIGLFAVFALALQQLDSAYNNPALWYALPASSIAMLIAMLLRAGVGMAAVVPAVIIVLLLADRGAPIAVYAAAQMMLAVSLVSHLTSRAQLRRATSRVAIAAPVLAMTAEIVLGQEERLALAMLAGLAGGVLGAILVQGLLPIFESAFRVPTVTALLDLADRNHPLLRELEQKALGSYQHSIMVATLTERACRDIGANALLGSVAGLYHDIGKIAKPHFFIENQQGIANPHDAIAPEVSAVIIQAHVIDGVRRARMHRFPAPVVSAIGSHHGTMLVSWFYNKAIERADGDASKVEERVFRYKGSKPRGKEAAVLFVADSAEAATRAQAMKSGTLTREAIEGTVDKLVSERVDDGQFDEADLTFDELRIVRNSIVEALVGVYHPRIDYPQSEKPVKTTA